MLSMSSICMEFEWTSLIGFNGKRKKNLMWLIHVDGRFWKNGDERWLSLHICRHRTPELYLRLLINVAVSAIVDCLHAVTSGWRLSVNLVNLFSRSFWYSRWSAWINVLFRFNASASLDRDMLRLTFVDDRRTITFEWILWKTIAAGCDECWAIRRRSLLDWGRYSLLPMDLDWQPC